MSTHNQTAPRRPETVPQLQSFGFPNQCHPDMTRNVTAMRHRPLTHGVVNSLVARKRPSPRYRLTSFAWNTYRVEQRWTCPHFLSLFRGNFQLLGNLIPRGQDHAAAFCRGGVTAKYSLRKLVTQRFGQHIDPVSVFSSLDFKGP